VILRLDGELVVKISIFIISISIINPSIDFQHGIKAWLLLKEGDIEIVFYNS
jgi:hypothetical protein